MGRACPCGHSTLLLCCICGLALVTCAFGVESVVEQEPNPIPIPGPNFRQLRQRERVHRHARKPQRRRLDGEPPLDRPFIVVPPPPFRDGSPRRRAFTSNASSSSSSGGDELRFSFALFSDTHFWPSSAMRSSFVERSGAAPVRDGLLIADSPSVFSELMQQV